MSSKTYFDNVAPEWDTMRQNFFPEEVRVTALARAKVIPDTMAADLGAGSGFMTEALLKMELQVIAVDQSQAMLNVMKAKFRRYNGRVAYRVGSADALPIRDNKVDFAFANMYLHHIEDPALAIREMTRIVKPGGKVVITDLDTHNHTFLLEEHHDRWLGFERDTIAQWFTDAGLQFVKVSGVGSDCCTTSECGTNSAQVSIFLAIGVKPRS
jgi:ubiquinone/menaquinone biosynthesis C-methylase UbiE